MGLKCIGFHGDDIVQALQEAKLGIVPKNGEVWCDEEDIPKAAEIIESILEKKKMDGRKYNIGGVNITSEIPIRVGYQGYPVDPVTRRDTINVHVFSKPTRGLDVTNDSSMKLKQVTINGEAINIDIQCYMPGYRGIVLADDKGFALFEVLPYNVFVLWNSNRSAEKSKVIFEKLVGFALLLANHNDPKSKEFYDDIFEKQRARREEIEMGIFEKMQADLIEKDLKSTKQSINDYKQHIDDAHNAIFENTKKLREIEVKIGVLEASRDNIKEKAKEEWQKIKHLEKAGRVSGIEILPDVLRFRTAMIRWRKDKKTDPIDLGEYEIEVKYSRGFSAKIKNLTKTLDYKGYRWDHPHCQDGKMCMGNLTQAMPEFAARREFEAMIMCMLKWLENVDIHDPWGADVTYWEKDHKKNTIKAKEPVETK